MLLDDPRDHALAAEPVFDFPARFARLADFQQRAAQPEAVADMDLRFGEPGTHEVFAEGRCTREQLVAAEPFVPCRVMIVRIVVHRHVHAAMMHGIGHHIAFDPEAADGNRAGNRALVDRAQFRAVEGVGQADANFGYRHHHLSSLRTVSAYQSRRMPSAPSPR